MNFNIGKSRFCRDLLPDPFSYYVTHLELLHGRGEWVSTLCPFHDDRNPSLSVNLNHGGFICHACGTRGGDVLSFHMQLHELDFVAAARNLGAWGSV